MCDTKDTIDPAANFPPAVEELFNFSEMEKKVMCFKNIMVRQA